MMHIHSDEKKYSISQVSRLTGVSSHTLRNWERRFEFISPMRAGNDFRSYSDRDVELIKRIAAHLAAGKRIREIAGMLRTGAILPAREDVPASAEWVALTDDLYRAMAAFRSDRAEHLSSILSAALTPTQMVERVYEPLLQRARGDAEAHRIGAPQEHFITASIRFRLCALANVCELPQTTARRCVVAGLNSERHEGRELTVTCLLKLRGRSVLHLGTHVAAEHLSQLDRSMPNLIFCVVAPAHFLGSRGFHRLKAFRNPLVMISEELAPPSSLSAQYAIITASASEVVRRVEACEL